MLIAVCLLVLAYGCRRPLYWISTRMLAFVIGFAIGWRCMARR